MLRIELIKSLIGTKVKNRATVHALGLRKMRQVVEQPDNPAIRGMIHRVKDMLVVTEVPDAAPVVEAKTEAATDEPKPKKRATKKAEAAE